MSHDWYKRNVVPQSPRNLAAIEATRFVIGPDGRAYPVASDDLPPAQNPQVQQYPVATQPWNRTQMPGEAPLGQVHVSEGLNYWRGSREANAADSGRCPGCGSANYFPTLRAQSDSGGESGKLSLGHCADCSYRSDGRGAPSMQMRGTMRGISSAGEIPVELSRQVGSNTDWSGRPSGGFNVVQKVLI